VFDIVTGDVERLGGRPSLSATCLLGCCPPRPEHLHPTDLLPGWGVPPQIVKVEILASTPLKH
jgi:hypothetical protein